MTKTVGVVIGRFQTHYLHKGHRELLDAVAKDHDYLIVLIGVHPTQPTARNPLDYFSRWQMISTAYPHAIIAPIEDQVSDDAWSALVDKKIRDSCATLQDINSAIVCGGMDSCLPCYHGRHTTKKYDIKQVISSTEMRIKAAFEPLKSDAFRRGEIYAITNRHPNPYLCVDVAMTNGDSVLLAKKATDAYYRFVGGFVDSADGCITEAARRELKEETGATAEQFQILGECKIEDWRYKKDAEKIFTVFYQCKYISGDVKANDDITTVEWVPINKIATTPFMPVHHNLKQMFLNRYKP